ncbi:hypothetical protein [Schaalia hyovaginalis]|nr:hypothetical protein [Schaalia hyovaginalis]MCI6557379.1 hypothetical protein [Schaalia hyovaginalis]MDD7554128.1 hypothetical protein [Schaalia hyovaginalis]MDY3094051.1 hypothetical protein [Schaalia hyovaginalis]
MDESSAADDRVDESGEEGRDEEEGEQVGRAREGRVMAEEGGERRADR